MRLAISFPLLLVGAALTARAQTPAATETTIRGVVFDSLEMHGLRGATVQMVDATGKPWANTQTADSLGRFEFVGVPSGTYLIGFFHPKADSLGLNSQILRVDVRTGAPIQVRLTVPSAQTIARALCGRTAVHDSTGLFMGYLRGAENSMPRPNGTVIVRWVEIVIEKGGLKRQVPSVEASSGSTGLTAVCGIPLGTTLMLQGVSASDSSGSFEVSVPGSGFLHRDIFVAPVTRVPVTTSDSAPPVELLRGAGRLRGRVVGTTGRPITGARVSFWGSGISALTDADGAFTLAGLPFGTHTLEVRAVGFEPIRQPVDVVQGAPGATEIELTNLGITLDTVRVTAQRLYTSRRRADFERRLHSGMGHIIDEDEIVKRNPMEVTDLLRTMPGVMVRPSRYSGEDVYMRGGLGILGPGICRPDLYIDGIRVTNDEMFPINQLVMASDLRAVEVYARQGTVPAELQSLSGCGVIALWTGRTRK
jgi:hypothetical protein